MWEAPALPLEIREGFLEEDISELRAVKGAEVSVWKGVPRRVNSIFKG